MSAVVAWHPTPEQEEVAVEVAVEREARKGGFVVWVARLQGDNVPEELVGKLVVYAPSGTDGLLASTVAGAPFIMGDGRLGRVIGTVDQ